MAAEEFLKVDLERDPFPHRVRTWREGLLMLGVLTLDPVFVFLTIYIM